jgi:hypothetical protein
MAFDRFLIAPITTGLDLSMRPFLIPEDAFTELQNAYVFRGRVRKRFGERLMGSGWVNQATEQLFSRFRINLGNTNGSGNISVTVPGAVFKVGQMFSIGTEIFTVVVTGAPGVMLTTGAATVHTYNTTNGALVINGAAAATPVYFYPAEPVMGLTNYENGPINNQPSYGFDTQFAYVFTGGAWQRSGTLLFNAHDNIKFVWTDNYRGLTPGGPPTMFVTNFSFTVPAPAATDDPIWYTQDGSTWTAATGANAFYFAPNGGAIHTGPYVKTARIIVGFKNRLLLLNTIENDNSGGAGVNTQYANRCRYSFIGSPFAANAWYEPNQTDAAGNIASGAGFVDATTQEQIVSAEFIKDRLIVYFERSTWELAYTGSQVLPFVWQKINTELGSEATFSSVPFDKVILTMGTTGVHACTGANVERIDTKIPDEIFEITQKDLGVQRVAGVRDYYTELVYWTFPSTRQNSLEIFPTQILVYNYRNDSWAVNTDCITAWGYFEQQNGMTWNSTTLTWEEADVLWDSGTIQAQFRQVIAGNQQGFTFIIDSDDSRNAKAMQITNMTQSGSNVQLKIIDHTLQVVVSSGDITEGDYIIIENIQGATLTDTNPDHDEQNGIFPISKVIDKDTVLIPNALLTGTYTGGGTAARVSNIAIMSKQWNPYIDKGVDVYLARIDFGVKRTGAGELTVDYFPSASELSMLDEGGPLGTNSLMGDGILETSAYSAALYPLEQEQNRLWHPVYFQSTGECIQIFMYMSDHQITQAAIAFAPFEMDGLILHTKMDSSRLQ